MLPLSGSASPHRTSYAVERERERDPGVPARFGVCPSAWAVTSWSEVLTVPGCARKRPEGAGGLTPSDRPL